MQHAANGHRKQREVVVVLGACFYISTDEPRFALAKRTVEMIGKAADNTRDGAATGLDVFMVVVDDSDENLKVKEILEGLGNHRVIVKRQQTKGRKGAACKDAIGYALEFVRQNVLTDANVKTVVFCLQEMEKHDMVNHLEICSRPIFDGVANVVIPARNRDGFAQGYAREQFFSESFGNAYLNNIWKAQFPSTPILEIGAEGSEEQGRDTDFYFGPLLWNAMELSHYWLEYNDGDQWDVQVVPLFHIAAVNPSQARMVSVRIPYRHDNEQKSEEEGDPKFCSKRLCQLNNIIPHVESHLAQLSAKKAGFNNPGVALAAVSAQHDSKRTKFGEETKV